MPHILYQMSAKMSVKNNGIYFHAGCGDSGNP